nr:NADH-quinone oxidoreductase subunit H [Burkholderiaceae bacterium]
MTADPDRGGHGCAGLRVLEVSVDLGAAYAGWLLGRLGAEVVRVDVGPRLAAVPQADRQRPSLARRFAHLDAGILWVLAISSLSVYGATMGAWASNSAYSLLGGLRTAAQM